MKLIAVVVVSSLMLSGCRKAPAPPPPQNSALEMSTATGTMITTPPEAQIDPDIKKLGDLCASRGISWRIQCDSMSNSDKPDYFGLAAFDKEDLNERYIEDGGKSSWVTYVDSSGEFDERYGHLPTPKEAAKRLYDVLQRAPNRKPEHRPGERTQAKKWCLRPITNENYKEATQLCCDN